MKKTTTKNKTTAFCKDIIFKNMISTIINSKKKYFNQCL